MVSVLAIIAASMTVSTFEAPWREAATVPAVAGAETIVVDTSKTDQAVMGFGVAMSELSWGSLSLLPEADRSAVLDELFTEKGGAFSVIRTPIGSSDFAYGYYSYDDFPGDFAMEKFSVKHDEQYLIPLIREVQKRVPAETLRIWASPWVPPQWLKVTGKYASRPFNAVDFQYMRQRGLDVEHPQGFMTDNGVRPDEQIFEGEDGFRADDAHLKAYALYFRKYIEAYRAYGIPIWMVMPQNEANSAMVYSSCTWSFPTMARFMGKYLGPALEGTGVKLFHGTIERGTMDMVNAVLKDPDCRRYVTGAGFQWAGRNAIVPTHLRYPELFLVQTEQECGDGKNDAAHARHCWELMKHYFDNGVSVYDYWNLSLEKGAPSPWGWTQNSLVSVDRETRTAKLNYEYYVLKHLSHFVKRGAKRVVLADGLDALAFANPDGSVVVALANGTDAEKTFNVALGGESAGFRLPANSLATLCLKKPTGK